MRDTGLRYWVCTCASFLSRKGGFSNFVEESIIGGCFKQHSNSHNSMGSRPIDAKTEIESPIISSWNIHNLFHEKIIKIAYLWTYQSVDPPFSLWEQQDSVMQQIRVTDTKQMLKFYLSLLKVWMYPFILHQCLFQVTIQCGIFIPDHSQILLLTLQPIGANLYSGWAENWSLFLMVSTMKQKEIQTRLEQQFQIIKGRK